MGTGATLFVARTTPGDQHQQPTVLSNSGNAHAPQPGEVVPKFRLGTCEPLP